MRFEGRIERRGRSWRAEVSEFDAVAQGRTKREALKNVEELLETLARSLDFRVMAFSMGGDTFEIEANHVGTLVALLLRRQRERQGLTVYEAAERLGQSSPNAYARYEQGQAMPSVEKLDQLLRAITPDQRIVMRLAE